LLARLGCTYVARILRRRPMTRPCSSSTICAAPRP